MIKMSNDARRSGISASEDVLMLAADKAQRYVNGVCERRVSPSEDALTLLLSFTSHFPPLRLPDRGHQQARPDGLGDHNGDHRGRYFGFVNGGMVPAAMAANWLAAAWNQNAALR